MKKKKHHPSDNSSTKLTTKSSEKLLFITKKQSGTKVGELGIPVLGMVAGFLRGKRAGQTGHLDPDRVVQILLRGVDRARNY